MGSPSAESAQQVILLVEDDETIGRTLQSALRAHGYRADWQRTGTGALIQAEQSGPDLVLLDLGLPDVDGVDVARDLRQRHPELIIVMLTARGDDIDVVVGLDVGADDYLVKPVRTSVLLARIRAHLRRREELRRLPMEGGLDDRSGFYQVGGLTVDSRARRCRVGAVEVLLRPKEFDLLVELVAHAGEAVRREDLMAAVWDEHWFGSTKTLDVTMAALRRALAEACATSEASADSVRLPPITTLRGHGYRLESLPETEAEDGSAAAEATDASEATGPRDAVHGVEVMDGGGD